MTRLAFLASLLGLTIRPDPCKRLRARIRHRLVLAREVDNCGASNDYADGYRQCGDDLVRWFDAST